MESEPMTDARLAELRSMGGYLIPPAIGECVAEVDRLRAELAARPEPIGYVVVTNTPDEGLFVYDELVHKTAKDAWFAKNIVQRDERVCALVPVDAL